MTTVLDGGTEQDAKALRLLGERTIAWFTTIAKDGAPRSVPVWFWWEDGTLYVLSEPDAGKVAHVRRGSPVLVHLETGPTGDDVVILHGSARIDDEPATSWLVPRRDAYVAKYAADIEAYGVPIDGIAEQFSTVIVFTPGRVQAW